MRLNNKILIALSVLFLFLGFQALNKAQPSQKSQRIYQEIKKYSPYYLEKRVGGFRIMMKGSKQKEQPPVTEVFNRLEQLESRWGKEHLKIDGNNLLVLDKDGKQIGIIPFHLPQEKQWVKSFFGI